MDKTRSQHATIEPKSTPIRVGSEMQNLIKRIRSLMASKNDKSFIKYDLSDSAVTDYIAKIFIAKGLA